MENRVLKNVATGLFVTSASLVMAQKQQPNFLLIVADDCSYYDIGCFGATNNETPNIDRLAREGVKFNRAYNSVSMSTPTRHCLYTGMYPVRNGGYANHSRVNPDVRSMPYYLGKSGYRVGLAGKWHINPEENFPFENVSGFPKACTGLNTVYTTDGIAEFMKRNEKEPFCLVVASTNPHAPWTGGDASVFDRAKLKLPPYFIDTPETREQYARYLAEVGLLDRQVGDVVALLKKYKLEDHTLVIFVSEQGSQFAGAKWTNWSAGVKSAMIARWPGKIRPGTETEAIVQYEDILPTFIDLAGGKAESVMDGRSLQKLLKGKTDAHRKYAFHVHHNFPEGPPYPIRSVSDGHYRLIWNLTSGREYKEKHIEKAPWFLSWKECQDEHSQRVMKRFKQRSEIEFYDIIADPMEMTNLADQAMYAGKIEELKKELQAWMKSQGDLGVEMDIVKHKKTNGQGVQKKKN